MNSDLGGRSFSRVAFKRLAGLAIDAGPRSEDVFRFIFVLRFRITFAVRFDALER